MGTVNFWMEAISNRIKQVQEWDATNPIRNNPVYARYFRLVELGVPLEAVKLTANLDGLLPEVLDLDANESIEHLREKVAPEIRLELDKSIRKEEKVENLYEMITGVDQAFEKRLLELKLVKAKSESAKRKEKKLKK